MPSLCSKVEFSAKMLLEFSVVIQKKVADLLIRNVKLKVAFSQSKLNLTKVLVGLK